MQQADVVSDLRRAVKSGDVTRVTWMLRYHWTDALRGDSDLFREAIQSLPTDVIEEHPVLSMAAEIFEPLTPSIVESGNQNIRRILAWLDDAEPSDDPHAQASAGLAALIGLRRRGDYPSAIELGRALEPLADRIHTPRYNPSSLTAGIQLHIGLVYLLAADLDRAARFFAAAFRKQVPSVNTSADAAGKLAFIHALQGEHQLARNWIRRSVDAEQREADWWYQHMEYVCRSAAELLLAIDRLDWSAYHRINDGIERLVPDECWTFILYARARAALQLGNHRTAIARIHQHREEFPRHLPDRSLQEILLSTAEAELWMSMRDLDRAGSIVDRLGSHPLEIATTARLLLLRRRPDKALELVREQNWPAGTSRRDHVKLLLLELNAHLRLKSGDDHRRHLLRRLSAEIGGRADPWLFTLTLADRDLITLLKGVSPVLDDLADALERADAVRPYAMITDQPNLTKRELVVLQYLAGDMPFPAIAQTLHVSMATIKNQRKSIYRKLGATSREHALEIAYRSGLITPPADDHS